MSSEVSVHTLPHSNTSKPNALRFALFFVLYELTTYLSNDMIMPAMLQVVHEYHASLSNVAYSLSYYIIGGSSLQIFLGPLSEKFGKRTILLLGNVLFLLATIGIVLATSMEQFLIGRLVQGMGLCFIFIGYATIHELFDDVGAVKMTALMANIAIFAPLVGPLIGGVITKISHWQFVFIISGILGVIALLGLYCYMPKPLSKPITHVVNLSTIWHSYRKILSNKTFMFGIFICGITLVPTIAWIGLAPTMIMDALQQTFARYISYQGLIFSGFIVSSLLIQKIAGKFSFAAIMRCGATLIVGGAIIAALCQHYENLIILGMIIYTVGEGLCYGIIVRIAITSTGESTALSSSAMSLLNCIYLASGLTISNLICGHFNYEISAYALFVLPFGIVSWLGIMHFALLLRPMQR